MSTQPDYITPPKNNFFSSSYAQWLTISWEQKKRKEEYIIKMGKKHTRGAYL